MADLLKPSGPKDNSRRRGVPAQLLAQRQKEAKERQEAYNKLSIQQKLDRPTCGVKERKKLLAKQNQTGVKK